MGHVVVGDTVIIPERPYLEAVSEDKPLEVRAFAGMAGLETYKNICEIHTPTHPPSHDVFVYNSTYYLTNMYTQQQIQHHFLSIHP